MSAGVTSLRAALFYLGVSIISRIEESGLQDGESEPAAQAGVHEEGEEVGEGERDQHEGEVHESRDEEAGGHDLATGAGLSVRDSE